MKTILICISFIFIVLSTQAQVVTDNQPDISTINLNISDKATHYQPPLTINKDIEIDRSELIKSKPYKPSKALTDKQRAKIGLPPKISEEEFKAMRDSVLKKFKHDDD